MQKLWKFIEVKLKFFSFIAGHVEHQHRTMMLFMYKDVHKIVSGLLRLFVEADVITKCRCYQKGDWLNFCWYSQEKEPTEGSG